MSKPLMGVVVPARENNAARMDRLQAAREAVVEAAMSWWEIREDPEEPSSVERLALGDVAAACAALDAAERGGAK